MSFQKRREQLRILRLALNEGPYEKRGLWRGHRYHFTNRGPSAQMGRFGGGWSRKVGVQMGGRTVILNLWKSNIRIDRKRVA